MKFSYLSKKVFGTILLPCSLTFFFLDVPAQAENSNQFLTKPVELAQQDLAQENEKLEKAVKEAQEAIDAASELANKKLTKRCEKLRKELIGDG